MTKQKPLFLFAVREDLKTSTTDFLPLKGEPHATGYDVKSSVDLVIKPGDFFKIPLGIRCMPPEGWWFELHPRSSSFVKKKIHGLIGIIDEHYPDELIFAGHYLPDDGKPLTIRFGDALGQIIPVERVEMDVEGISNEEFDRRCRERKAVRTGGFGSTSS